MAIFDRMNYNPELTANSVTEYNDAVNKHMEFMPKLLDDWQITDIENDDIGGYYKNPVANVAQDIWNASNTLISIPEMANTVPTILSSAQSLYTSVFNYMPHTNRLSGLLYPTDVTNMNYPYLDMAINNGKLVSYIVYQSDGVQNNAPIMGHFTSLFINDELETKYQTIQNYPEMVLNSISMISTDDGQGGQTWSNTSSLTSTEINQISSDLLSISTLMNSRVTADTNFFNNSKSIVQQYNTVKNFSNMGQTKTDLINNYIGSDKLKSRLNS